jgi:uncharacterized protein YqeY
MNLFEQIKQQRDIARKERNQVTLTLLSTLIGEIETKHRSNDKNYSDLIQASQKVIKQTIDSCKEMYELKKDDKFLNEISVLEKLLPKSLEDDEIKVIINDIKEKILDIKILTKEVMSYLKTNYFGRYDSTKVLQFIKEI